MKKIFKTLQEQVIRARSQEFAEAKVSYLHRIEHHRFFPANRKGDYVLAKLCTSFPVDLDRPYIIIDDDTVRAREVYIKLLPGNNKEFKICQVGIPENNLETKQFFGFNSHYNFFTIGETVKPLFNK